jgi:hypothetical protein
MTTLAHHREIRMSTTSLAPAVPDSRARLWTGRILTAIPVLFLLMDGVMKFTHIPEVVKGTSELGWDPSITPTLGVLLLTSLALYLFPRTAVLGAILLTGYLGGAIATHLRIGNPLFTHILFPVYVALMLWGGLYLRDARLRTLIPFRDTQA